MFPAGDLLADGDVNDTMFREGGKDMFGCMKAQAIIRVTPSAPVGEAVDALLKATDKAQAVRWIEFPATVLLFVVVPRDEQSGAIYVLDRRTGTWLWIDFEDEEYGGYCVNDFDLLVHEYDFLSLVERPGLLKASAGWLLEPCKPAEMAVQHCK